MNEVVSIVIPSYNRKENLMKTLFCLTRQTALGKFEVMVVDDGSTDGTSGVLGGQPWPFKLQVMHLEKAEEKWGASIPRNVGARLTSPDSKAIIFMDSDVLIPPHVIETFIQDYETNPLPDRIIVAPYRFLNHTIEPHVEGWWESIQPNEYAEDVRIKMFEGRDPQTLSIGLGEAMSCFGGLIFIPREWFCKTGGFEEDLFAGVEDGAMGVTLFEMNSKFSYDIRLMGWHNPHPIIPSRTENIKGNLEILDTRHKMDIVKTTGEAQRQWGIDWTIDPTWVLGFGYDPKKLL